MKSNNLAIMLITAALLAGCGGGGSNNPANNNAGTNPGSSNGAVNLTAINSGFFGAGSDTVSFQIGNFTNLNNTGNNVFNNVGGPAADSSFDWGLPFFLGQNVFVGMGVNAFVAHSSNDGTLASGANVLPVTVNGSSCSPFTSVSYLNKPCVSVTVCTPGTSTCQTINDILLDTGSYGLRIFKSALSVPLNQLPATNSQNLAECTSFLGNFSLWGSVQNAKIALANEPAITIPIQVIDPTFGTNSVASVCQNVRTDPVDAGFTGILGVGTAPTDPGPYFACNGTNCTQTTTATRISNPVRSLPVDNNGVMVQFLTVPATGSASTNGSLVLGIGTQTNNTLPSSAVKLATDQAGDFVTTLGGQTFDSFLDTGSNGLFFNAPPSFAALLPICGAGDWYCP